MKAVSPLLAGVLMIAFVLAVAAIVGGWLTSIAKTETTQIETGMTTQVNCSKGSLAIVYVSCGLDEGRTISGEGGRPDRLNVTISNTGQLTLTDFSLSGDITTGGIFANSSTYKLSLALGAMGNLFYDFVDNTTYSGVIKQIRVSAQNCPSVFAEDLSKSYSCP